MKPKNETDLFRAARYEARELEDLQAETSHATPQKLGLPTTWRDAEGPVVLPGRHTPIIRPTPSDVEAFGADGGRATCGSCQHFDIERGRDKIIEERFAERLVREQEWQLKHLGVPPDMLGMCGLSDDMVTTIISKSCDQYREARRRGGRWRL